MSEVFLGSNATVVTDSPEVSGYSKVIINISEEESIEVGTDDGLVMELDCPWGTQQMAENILESLNGFVYQPYKADGSLLNPASELGDAVTVHGTYGAVYKKDTEFTSLHSSDIEAPFDEEMDHEYEYEPQQERKVKRQFENVKSELSIQAGEIAARVTREGGDNASFGWSLTEDGFILSSGNTPVFECDSNGIKVHGKIEATEGFIGTNSDVGFIITSRAIRNGVESFSDTEHGGIYLGTDGIVLGKGAFKVDTSGNLYAKSGTFEGNIYAGNIQYGGSYGTFNGSGLSGGSVGTGKITDGAITKAKLEKALGVDIDATKAYVNSVAWGSSGIQVPNNGLKMAGMVIGIHTATTASGTIHYLGY